MNIIFISDFFKQDLLGGAESNDAVLINFLETKKHNVTKLQCASFTESLLEKNNFFIISNFISLSIENRKKLKNENYIIYEHDHKYINSRDPSAYKNFDIPPQDLTNIDFYQNAKAVVVLSQICKDIIEKNLHINNVYNIGCSLWSDEKLDFISTLTTEQKNKKFAIINSNNPIKNTQLASFYCEKNNIDFDLIGPSS